MLLMSLASLISVLTVDLIICLLFKICPNKFIDFCQISFYSPYTRLQSSIKSFVLRKRLSNQCLYVTSSILLFFNNRLAFGWIELLISDCKSCMRTVKIDLTKVNRLIAQCKHCYIITMQSQQPKVRKLKRQYVNIFKLRFSMEKQSTKSWNIYTQQYIQLIQCTFHENIF